MAENFKGNLSAVNILQNFLLYAALISTSYSQK
jgi:hypothetical protein